MLLTHSQGQINVNLLQVLKYSGTSYVFNIWCSVDGGLLDTAFESISYEYDRFNKYMNERAKNRYVIQPAVPGAGARNDIVPYNGNERSDTTLQVKEESIPIEERYIPKTNQNVYKEYDDKKMERRRVSQKRAPYVHIDKHYATEWDEL